MATHSSILAWRTPGQRSLVGYSPWGLKESDMTEHLTHTFGSVCHCGLHNLCEECGVIEARQPLALLNMILLSSG